MKPHNKHFIIIFFGILIIPITFIILSTEVIEPELKNITLGKIFLILAFSTITFTFGFYISKPRDYLKKIFS